MGKFNQIRVVVPTFNEAENITKLSSALFDLRLDGLSMLVVDDNSPDGTGKIADDLSKSYPGRFSVLHRKGKKGLGSAYIEGFGQALNLGADAIVQMDADFSHPPEKVVDLVENLAGSDVAMGSRYIPGGSLDEQWPMWRKGLSAFGNIYAKSILQLPVHDATGGFRAWRKETLLAMPLNRVRSNGYAFQVEMIYLAYRLGCKISEVPFYFADRKWGTSKMSFAIQIEAAFRVWQMLFEYRDLEAIADSKSSSLTL
jgi:dolichol-phosphate mannosyltransferase